ncbi:MAG TPA: hypothetical protein VKW06_08960 [Candidatus Angelobacter sp.]|nr:hypothetical protein [Candidatus Angelobacter sp.]
MARQKKPTLTPEAKRFFVAAGSRGGKKRTAGMSKAERSELGKKAARARWAKKNG